MNTYTLVHSVVSWNKDCLANIYYYVCLYKLVYTNVFDYTQDEKQITQVNNNFNK